MSKTPTRKPAPAPRAKADGKGKPRPGKLPPSPGRATLAPRVAASAAPGRAAPKRPAAAKPAPAPKRKPAHRPPYEPTDKDRTTVRAMVAGGIDQEIIGTVIGMSGRNLRRHFRREIDTAAAQANAGVVASLYRMATSGDCVAAAIFWAKTRMGWTEKLILQNGGTADDLKALPDAELTERIAKLTGKLMLGKAAPGAH